MPRKITKKTSVARGIEAEQISYETRLLIVILLLLFVYPIGLLVMWMWMKSWPVWLKLLISLPLLLGIIGFLGLIAFIGVIIHNARNGFKQERLKEWQQMYQHRQMMYITPTISPTISPNPTTTSTQTF